MAPSKSIDEEAMDASPRGTGRDAEDAVPPPPPLPSRAVDWATALDDDFEENAPPTKGFGAPPIEPSPTWVSVEDGSIAFPGFPPVDSSEGADAPAATGKNEVEKLRKMLRGTAAALAVFVVLSLSLGVALGFVSARGDDAALSPAAAAPAGVQAGQDEAGVDPELAPLVDNTVPAQLQLAASPTSLPSAKATGRPTTKPSPSPTGQPSASPATNAPSDPYYFGDLSILDEELGIEVSAGLSVRLVARTGERVAYATGEESDEDFHEAMDAAGIIPLEDGGYVYVSNSEVWDGDGGVYGLYFSSDGNVTEYKTLLEGTSGNCGGGLSPWKTWISCEEDDGGQCWQIDPDPASPNHYNPMATNLGGEDGGTYESVAVDNRNPERPVFYVTEDLDDGALRRVVVNGSGWDALHTDAVETSYLRILDETTFEWTDDEKDARKSAEDYYPNSEGISFHEEEGRVYFMSKVTETLLVLDLESLTYEYETTGFKFYGDGSFNDQPDQGLFFGPRYRHMFFTEDGGSTPGVYARLGSTGTYYTVFQGLSSEYDGDETSGIALSPDGTRLYAAFQEAGLLFEFTRDDGLPFE